MEIPANVEKKCLRYGNQQLENPVFVGYGVDNVFAMPMGVSITSVLLSNPHTNFSFHIVTDGLMDDTLSRLKLLAEEHDNCNVNVHILDTSFFDVLPTVSWYTKATYNRFLLVKLLHGLADIIIYIDCDMICRRPLPDFSDMFDAKTILLAVPDAAESQAVARKNLNINREYFNAGFLVINVDLWMQQHISERAIEYLEQHDNLSFLDQDALNAIAGANTKFLSQKYNFFYYPELAAKQMLPDDVVIVHFTSRGKPWHVWAEHKGEKIFLAVKDQSPWRDCPLPLPRNFKQRHAIAKYCVRNHEYNQAALWYIRYFITKMHEKYLHF